MMRRQTLGVVVLLAWAMNGYAVAQTARTPPEELRRQVERRFDVLTVREGLVLRPKTPIRGVRAIEVSGGDIAIDGVSATGAELRERLGGDVDLVLQLSYLDPAAQRELFNPTPASARPETPPPPEPPAAAPEPPTRPERDRRDASRRRQSGQRVRIGGGVTVDEDETIRGDVVAIGGSARVFGEVRGEVVSIAGTVELGPNAVVHRDVTVVGGTLRRDPSARIDGEINEIGIGAIDLSGVRWSPPSLGALWWGWTLGAAYRFVATLVRVAVLCLLAALVLLLGRDYVERVSLRAAGEPLKAGAIGFLAQLLFLPLLIITIVLLVVTIIGIPLLVLLPFAVLGLGVFALIGFTAVSFHVGRLLSSRLGWDGLGVFGFTIAGILLIMSPILLARLIGLGGGVLYPMTIGLGLVGLLVEYLAWTVGFGAVALDRFGKALSSPPATSLPATPLSDAPAASS
jgi:hypothetical protein